MEIRSTSLPSDKLISCFNDSTQACVKVLNPAGDVMSFNDYGIKLMEIDDPKQVIGHSWWELWPEEGRQTVINAVEKATKEGQPSSFEALCPTGKGNLKYWHVDVVPLYNNFGQVEWLLAMSRDATELFNFRQKFGEVPLDVAYVAEEK